MSLFKNFLLFFLFTSFILGQLGRIEITSGISITVLDTAVFLFSLSFFLKYGVEKITQESLFKPILLFTTVCLLSLIVNSFYLKQEQLIASFLYLVRWILYASVYFVVKSEKNKSAFSKGLLISGMSITGLGYIQYIFYPSLKNLFYLGWDEHMYRIFSTFLDPNFAGAFFVLFFLFIFGLFAQEKKKSGQFIAIIVVTLLAIFLTFSRSAFLMLMASVIALTSLLNKKKWIGYIFAIFFFLILLAVPKFNVENINLFRVVSTEARIKSAQEAFTIIQSSPIVGVGFNAYRYAQVRLGIRNPIGAETSHSDGGTDNSFLFVFATTGVIGFISYIYLLFSILKSAISTKSFLSFVAIASFVGLLVNSQFVNSLFYPSLMLWMWILVGIMDYK